MEINILKGNISVFSNQFVKFQEKDYQEDWLKTLRKGTDFIKIVVDFINNQHNLDILQKYSTNNHKNIEECPLGKLSKDILESLSNLNDFIEKMYFQMKHNLRRHMTLFKSM